MGLAGCTFSGPGGDGGDGGDGGGGGVPDTITIGSLGPSEMPFGSSIHNSVKLAAEEINSNGGIAGANVEVVVKDTKDDPSTARSVYQELTTGENVDLTVGLFGSENMLALMPNIAQQKTVHLTAGAATPEAPHQVKQDYEKNKYWFRVGPVNSVFLGESMVTFAGKMFDELGWESIGLLIEDYKWTKPVEKVLNDKLSQHVDITVQKRVSEGTEDFTPIYDELESAGVDGAYTALAHIGTNSLVQWAKGQRQFGYGGIHVPTQLPSFYGATKGAAIATFSQTTATPQSKITDKTIPYSNAYKKKYDGYPVYNGYSAYDAVYMYKKAVEAGSTTNSDEIVSQLESMSYTGTSGTLEFYGKNAEFPHDVKYGPKFARAIYFQWQPDDQGNGRQEVIYPDELATSEYMKAPWIK